MFFFFFFKKGSFKNLQGKPKCWFFGISVKPPFRNFIFKSVPLYLNIIAFLLPLSLVTLLHKIKLIIGKHNHREPLSYCTRDTVLIFDQD